MLAISNYCRHSFLCKKNATGYLNFFLIRSHNNYGLKKSETALFTKHLFFQRGIANPQNSGKLIAFKFVSTKDWPLKVIPHQHGQPSKNYFERTDPIWSPKSDKFNLTEWKETCSQQCVIRVVSLFFKLIYMVVHGFLRMIYLVGRAIFGGKTQKAVMEKVKEKAKSTATEAAKTAGHSMIKGAKKSGVFMARELPKAFDKIQTNAPIWKKNTQEFLKHVHSQLSNATTPQERNAVLRQIALDALKMALKSKAGHNLVLILFGYAVFIAARFYFRLRGSSSSA